MEHNPIGAQPDRLPAALLVGQWFSPPVCDPRPQNTGKIGSANPRRYNARTVASDP